MEIRLLTGRPNEVGQADVFVLTRYKDSLNLAIRDSAGQMRRLNADFGSSITIDGIIWALAELPIDVDQVAAGEDGAPFTVALLKSSAS